MRYFISIALLVASSASNTFAAKTEGYRFKLKQSITPPYGWVKYGLPPSDHNINLRIALPQPNFNVLEQHLFEVSDPFHERYGNHLSKEEVESLVAPHKESLDEVDNWLASFGIGEGDIQRSPAKDWVKLMIPISLAEKMLDTTYYVWKHLESGDFLVRTTSYSLPEELDSHVDLVQPTTMFGRFKPSKSTIISMEDAAEDFIKKLKTAFNPNKDPTVDPTCNTTITVDCLNQLYNAVDYDNKGRGSIGITGYLEEFANIQDLQSFYAEQRPDALGSNFTFISVKGGINNQTLSAAGAEANLDVQFAFGISHPIPPTFWSTAGRPPFIPDVGTPTNTNEPYLDWLDALAENKNPPLAISTSYGDHEQTVPRDYAQRACNGFAQLGARGISVMFSSGDGGVGDGNTNPETQQCFTNDGRNETKFIPLFPATCPFVTSVGGTAGVPEVAVSRFFSGGGFSNYFKRPEYQEKTIKTYLNSLPKGLYKGLYNPEGRAHPDVAAQGDRFRIWLRGRPVLIGGTSASAPAFTGYVALLNDARLSKGLKPLGFLNPLIYSHPDAFNDITIGNNGGCGTPGFNATKGWDPVTGFGTPNFGKLVKLVT